MEKKSENPVLINMVFKEYKRGKNLKKVEISQLGDHAHYVLLRKKNYHQPKRNRRKLRRLPQPIT